MAHAWRGAVRAVYAVGAGAMGLGQNSAVRGRGASEGGGREAHAGRRGWPRAPRMAAEGARPRPAYRAPPDPRGQNGGVAAPCGDAGAPRVVPGGGGLDTYVNKNLPQWPAGGSAAGHEGPLRPGPAPCESVGLRARPLCAHRPSEPAPATRRVLFVAGDSPFQAPLFYFCLSPCRFAVGLCLCSAPVVYVKPPAVNFMKTCKFLGF